MMEERLNTGKWRCPICETLNDGDRCVICSSPRVTQEESDAMRSTYETTAVRKYRYESLDDTDTHTGDGYYYPKTKGTFWPKFIEWALPLLYTGLTALLVFVVYSLIN